MRLPKNHQNLSPFEALLAAIEAGDIVSGERLQEIKLAKQFGLSRTPIREALHRLEALGLVEPGPQRGLVLATLSYERLRQLFAVREGMERLAIELAVANASADELQLLDDMTRVESKISDARMLHDHNRLFHSQIYRFSHNPYLEEMMTNLRVHLSLLPGTTYQVPARREEARAEHKALVDAMAGRDKARAVTIACDHLRNGLRVRMAMINSAGG